MLSEAWMFTDSPSPERRMKSVPRDPVLEFRECATEYLKRWEITNLTWRKDWVGDGILFSGSGMRLLNCGEKVAVHTLVPKARIKQPPNC